MNTRQLFREAFWVGFKYGASAMCKLSNGDGGAGVEDIKRMEASSWRKLFSKRRTVRNNQPKGKQCQSQKL